MKTPEGINWVNFPSIGSKGLDVFNDASLIDNLALTEAENITFDGGFLSPIKGSTLLTEKPTGESGDALQLITAKTSDGLEYLVGVYANHFYLWHSDNSEWLRINTTYVPTETTRPYGYVNWNNGRSDDRLYVCNGVDNFARWDVCYSDDTEVLTEDGFLFLKNIVENKLKVKVATLNQKTNELEYNYPDKYYSFEHEGKMLHQGGKAIDYLVTEHHRNWVLPMRDKAVKKSDKFRFVESKDLPKHVYYQRGADWKGKEKEFFTLGEKKIRMDEWLDFFGFWITEGCTFQSSNGKCGNHYTVVITQKDRKVLQKYQRILDRWGYPSDIIKSPKATAYNLRIRYKELYEHLVQFGKSNSKFIPKEIKSLSRRQLHILFDSLLHGDGHTNKSGTITYVTVSKRLSDDVQEIAIKIGLAGTIGTFDAHQTYNKEKNKKINHQKRYNVIISKKVITAPREKREWVNYSGKVYCLEVKNNLLYARRNGKSLWSGNCVSTVSGAHSTGATTVTLTDGTRFPASGGTLVLMGASSISTEAYTSRTGNVFTLTGTLSQDIADGASATLDMIEKSGMEIGKIVGKYQQRLIVCNYYGGETTGWYSVQTDPEDFTTGTGVADASTFVISDGNGEITGFHDFGAFAVIEKEDSIHRLEIVVDDTLASKLDKITPILSGESLGPLGQLSTLKILNTLYYPTKSNGFISLYPAGTGSDTNVNYKTLSQMIDPLLDTLTITDSNCRGAATSNKAFWAVAIDGGTQNTKVLIYDALRDTWSVRTSWAVKDFAVKDDILHYLDSSNGRVFQCFVAGYNDNNNPYQVKYSTKRYDFGLMSEPKSEDTVYIQGYMTPSTKLYVDVLFNEGGILNTQTFLISKDTERLLFSQPLTNALGEFLLGVVPMGWVTLQEIGNLSFFRAYLGVNPGIGYFNIQLRFRANDSSFHGITGIGFLPRKEMVPGLMVLSPVD